MMRIRGLVTAMMALAIVAVQATAGETQGASTKFDPSSLEFFEKQVRPILLARCLGCHGPEKQKGGLRLDSRAAALSGGESGPAVVPGKPAESALVDAINYGETVQMPPKSKLPPEEIVTLTKWVEMQAPWTETVHAKSVGTDSSASAWKQRTKHWSLQPVRRVEPPAVVDLAWPKNPIDRFLLAGLEAGGLRPAPDSDRRGWIRRISFDLIGLPPKPEEVEAFVADQADDAHEKVVDRLLASPHYGERWGRHWLDLVRYAETSGHEFDYDIPDAWRYRDYVIRAFNVDLPYDQFVTEHLAGDLLASPRRDPVDGTNESILGTGFFFLTEGVHSPVDLREEEAARIDNQIEVFGKAFLGLTIACARCHDHKFDAITTRDYYALSGYLKSSRHQHAFLDSIERTGGKVAELEAIKADVARAIGRRGGLPDVPSTRIANDGSIVFEDFNRSTYEGWFVSGEAFGSGPSPAGDFRIQASDQSATAITLGQAHSGRLSDRLQGTLRSRTFTIEQSFVHFLASGKDGRINLVIDGFEKIRAPIYGGLAIDVDSCKNAKWYTIDIAMWRGHRAYVELSDGATVDYTGARSHYTKGNGYLAVDEIRFSDSKQPPSYAPKSEAKSVPLDDPSVNTLVTRYHEIESQIVPPTLGPTITEGTEEDDRVHIRGSSRNLGEAVPRRFLEVLGGAESSEPTTGSGRRELARRIVDPSNPLTSRVMVNRLWKHHFGEGLVRSPDDFGLMGQAPSHPALLDWLAVEFVQSGWSIKHMHQLMVLSHAYRMASTVNPEADKVDPTNRLLHRMNVRRLEAEAVRDAMLAVSGRLDPSMFGPSIATHLTPFMEGRGRPSLSGPLDGAGRRSVYLSVRRNFLSPFLLAFDFPTPSTCIGRRNVSNVPAQALTLLNDPFVIEQAASWAQRSQRSNAPRVQRLDALYRTAFGRPPTEQEQKEALSFLETQTWPDLCHVLMNTKEFLFIP